MNITSSPTLASSPLLYLPSLRPLISKSHNQNPLTPTSTRMSQKSFRLANLRKASQESAKQLLVQLQNEQLYLQLREYCIPGLTRFYRPVECEKKELFVVSKIEDFYLQYNKDFDSVYSQMDKVSWIIITNAINNTEIQEQFNHNYEPITFAFVRDTQQIANHLNFANNHNKRTVRLEYFSRIVNFGVFDNPYSYILQGGNSYVPDKNEELWLISRQKVKQARLLTYFPCYLGENSLKGQQIQIYSLNGQNIVYLLIVDNYEIYLQSTGIMQLEKGLAKMKEEYEEIRGLLPKVSIVATEIDSILLKEINHYTGNQVVMLESNQIHQSDKPVILLSNNAQLARQSSIISINVSQYASYEEIHRQLIRQIKKVSQRSQPSLYKITSVTNFTNELKELQSQQSRAYKVFPILDFTTFLQSLRDNTSHLVIMEMNEYTEQRQQQLKETQHIINGTIEVYLSYGNQFIFRNKSKYTFLKKDQLLKKIKEIISQAMSEEEERLELDYRSQFGKYYSQVKPGKQSLRLAQTVSTPNLMHYFPQNNSSVIFLIPKGIPHYSLMDRSITPYSLLVYNKPEQITELIKYLPNDSYACIIMDQSNFPSLQAKILNSSTQQNTNSSNTTKDLFQFIKVTDPSEKTLRSEIDKAILRLQLQPKKGSTSSKVKNIPIVLLYSHSDERQIKIIRKMGQLFKNSKIVTMSKKEFKTLKKSYCIAENINVYELGRPEISHTKRLKTILDVFKVYMAPQIASLQYSTQKLQFSKKQLFLRTLLDKTKRMKMSRISEISINRSVSPKGKSFLQKECFVSQPGLAILQSKTISKLTKKQKFSGIQQLIGLCLDHLSKGNQVLIVIDEQKFFDMKDQVALYSLETTWLVLASDYKNCIIRQSNIVFCKEDQFDQTLSLVVEAFRAFKAKGFQLSLSLKQMLQSVDNTASKDGFMVQVARQLPSSSQDLSIFLGQNTSKYSLQQLGSSLIFPSLSKLSHFFSKSPYNDCEDDAIQPIFIVCNHHNTKFIEQSLQILKQTHYIIITFQHIGALISYSCPSKTLFILEKPCALKTSNLLQVSPSQTACSFSSRLRVLILSLQG